MKITIDEQEFLKHCTDETARLIGVMKDHGADEGTVNAFMYIIAVYTVCLSERIFGKEEENDI